jgi:amidohydrolase
MPEWKGLVSRNKSEIVALRRYFHAYPEVGGAEVQTQKKIMDELAAMGLKPRRAGGTGVIADLMGGMPGRRIALRADMDALPVRDECAKSYQSQYEGVCHACGHDGHIAMLLGVAKVLTAAKSHVQGSIRFIFQPSEEKHPGGAKTLIAEGCLEDVDYIIGCHLWQTVASGQIGITYGRMMAASDEFVITVCGKGGHASMPHQTIDALLTAAQVAVALNTIVGRAVDPFEQAVVSLGVFQSGKVHNVIAEKAVLKGTVRAFNEEMRRSLADRIKKLATGICSAAGAECTIDHTWGYPPVINNPDVVAVVAKAGRETLGAGGVIEITPVMAAEDFSYYLQRVPGAFLFVGIGNEKKGIVFPQHHGKFDIDEDALEYGVEVMIRAALQLLEKGC